jgi:hypothetical protein
MMSRYKSIVFRVCSEAFRRSIRLEIFHVLIYRMYPCIQRHVSYIRVHLFDS